MPLLAQIWRDPETVFRSQLQTIFATVEKRTARLSELVAADNAETQACAVEILGELADIRQLPVLRRALESPAGSVRYQAALALGRRRDVEAVPALCREAQSTPELRQECIWALGEIGDAAATPTLASFLAGSSRVGDVAVRRAAATALGQIKDPAAQPALSLAAVRDDAPTVRASAVEALGLVGEPGGVPALLQALSDGALFVAVQAVEALGSIGQPSVLPALCHVLLHGDVHLRVHVPSALGQIGGGPAIDGLCQALGDPDAVVRFQVVYALQLLAEPKAVVPLQLRAAIPQLQAMGSPLSRETKELRSAAREALRRIEAGTGKLKQLPLPADSAFPSATLLPLPAEPTAASPTADSAHEPLRAHACDGR